MTLVDHPSVSPHSHPIEDMCADTRVLQSRKALFHTPLNIRASLAWPVPENSAGRLSSEEFFSIMYIRWHLPRELVVAYQSSPLFRHTMPEFVEPARVKVRIPHLLGLMTPDHRAFAIASIHIRRLECILVCLQASPVLTKWWREPLKRRTPGVYELLLTLKSRPYECGVLIAVVGIDATKTSWRSVFEVEVCMDPSARPVRMPVKDLVPFLEAHTLEHTLESCPCLDLCVEAPSVGCITDPLFTVVS